MQFQVPQFIETEDKVVGPLSLRQFAYIGTAGAIAGVLMFVLDFWLWVIMAIPILGTGAIFAFGKVNGRPISTYTVSLFQSIWAPSVYVFRPKSEFESSQQIELEKKAPHTPKLSKLPKPSFKGVGGIRVVPDKKPPRILKAEPESKPSSEGIKNLWMQMNTSKTAIPKRERALPVRDQSFSKFKEKFEAIRHITGEKEVAKRIDYR